MISRHRPWSTDVRAFSPKEALHRLARASKLWRLLHNRWEFASRRSGPTALRFAEIERRLWRVTGYVLQLGGEIQKYLQRPSIDPEILRFAGSKIAEAMRGFPPDAFSKKRGGRNKTATQKAAESAAVEFLCMAESGELNYGKYPKLEKLGCMGMVTTNFSISISTVNRWRNMPADQGWRAAFRKDVDEHAARMGGDREVAALACLTVHGERWQKDGLKRRR
jgi:hypothetical protein